MSNMTNMSKARAKLLIQQPFFASLIMSSPWVATRDIPTAATNGRTFFYNPDFMDSLTLDENMGVQCHEALHDAFMHMTRLSGRNPMLWNMACDYAINHIILKAGMKLPEGCLVDEKLGVHSAEVIYEMLKKKAEENRKKRAKEGQPGQPGDGLPEDVLGRDLQDTPDAGEPGEQIKREQQIRQRVAQAANIARMAGKMPAGLERFIDAVLNPRVPWQQMLQEYMTRIVKSDESWAKRNRRFQHVYLPSRFSETMGPIGLIGDTSGSITNEDLNMVAAEFRSIAEECKPERVHMLWADTQVAQHDIFEAGDELRFNAKGGGGTDMRVPLTYIADHECEVVVLITDGYTPWPKEDSPYPLIVVCTTDAHVPIGQVVRLH